MKQISFLICIWVFHSLAYGNPYNLDTSSGLTCPAPNTGIGLTYDCTSIYPDSTVTLGTFTDINPAGTVLSSINLGAYGPCDGDYAFSINGVQIATGTVSGQPCNCPSHPGTLQTYPVTVTPAIQAAFVAGGTNTLTVTALAPAVGCFYGADIEVSTNTAAASTAANIPVFSPFGLLAMLAGLVWFGSRRRTRG